MFEAFPGRFLQKSLSLDEACYGYHKPTKNIFNIQENDHLCCSSENILFPLEFQFFALSVS